jgi:hypothetical protein
LLSRRNFAAATLLAATLAVVQPAEAQEVRGQAEDPTGSVGPEAPRFASLDDATVGDFFSLFLPDEYASASRSTVREMDGTPINEGATALMPEGGMLGLGLWFNSNGKASDTNLTCSMTFSGGEAYGRAAVAVIEVESGEVVAMFKGEGAIVELYDSFPANPDLDYRAVAGVALGLKGDIFPLCQVREAVWELS